MDDTLITLSKFMDSRDSTHVSTYAAAAGTTTMYIAHIYACMVSLIYVCTISSSGVSVGALYKELPIITQCRFDIWKAILPVRPSLQLLCMLYVHNLYWLHILDCEHATMEDVTHHMNPLHGCPSSSPLTYTDSYKINHTYTTLCNYGVHMINSRWNAEA